MASRDISSLPLSHRTIELLHRSGYRMYGDLQILLNNLPSILEFSSDLRVKVSEAQAVLQELKGLPIDRFDENNENNSGQLNSNTNPENNEKLASIKRLTPISAQEMLSRNQKINHIVTFSKAIDNMLGKGVHLGQLTEICGVPGIGKTQFSIQLAIDVQIPTSFGGLDGECIYIDTEGSFHIERVKAIAEGLYLHLTNISKKKRKASESSTTTTTSENRKESEEVLANKTPDHLMNGIYFIRVHDSTELLAVINRLTSLIDQSPKVKLVMIDSIAFPFRQSLQDVAWRTRIVGGVAQTLQQVAYEKNVAVVVTNHVTTKFNKTKAKSMDVDIAHERKNDDLDKILVNDCTIREIWNTTSHLVPALGEAWSHAVTNRVMMHYHHNERCASLMKSPNMKCSSTVFTITEDGVRDVNKKEHGGQNKMGRI